MKKGFRIVSIVLIIYLLYALITGAVIYGVIEPKKTDYKDTNPIERFYGDKIGVDKVALIEKRVEAGLVRINFLENAEETIEMSYYAFQEGVSANIFIGSLLEAADRGVKVKILLDGFFNGLKGELKDVIYVFSNHPNIELKFYEPFSLTKPWTWNNRLHDKFIIVDNKLAIIGGRNIGDRYFAPDNKKIVPTDDRDVVVVNTEPEKETGSCIEDFKSYFSQAWNSEFSKYPVKGLSKREEKKANDKEKMLKEYLLLAKKDKPDMFNIDIDWEKVSTPTKKITLINNPLTRFNKEPWVWLDIARLVEKSQKSIFIQSPYIIPTEEMLEMLKEKAESNYSIEVLTNSLYSTPNYLAYSGYIRHRKNISETVGKLYEYQGDESIHGKSIIFDDRLSLVGSFNMEARSIYLSTETMVVIDSEEFAKVLKNEVNRAINKSLQVGEGGQYIETQEVAEKKSPLIKKIIIKILSYLTYFFDYLL